MKAKTSKSKTVAAVIAAEKIYTPEELLHKYNYRIVRCKEKLQDKVGVGAESRIRLVTKLSSDESIESLISWGANFVKDDVWATTAAEILEIVGRGDYDLPTVLGFVVDRMRSNIRYSYYASSTSALHNACDLLKREVAEDVIQFCENHIHYIATARAELEVL